MTIELITALGGSVAGYVMKLISIRSQQQHELMRMALDNREQADSSSNQAAARVGIDAGRFVRRTIVLSVLFGVVLLPILAPLLGLPVVVEGEEAGRSWLFGLIEEETRVVFHEIRGVLLLPELRQVFLALASFYFGQGAARAR